MNAIFAEENEQLGHRARLARARLGAPAVARARRRQGAVRGVVRGAPRARDDEAWLGVDASNPTGALRPVRGPRVPRRAPGRRSGRPIEPALSTASGVGAAADGGTAQAGSRPAAPDQREPRLLAADRRRRPVPRAGPGSPSSSAAQAVERLDHLPRAPPGRSTRPSRRANSVSPLNSRPVVLVEQADRALGVARRVQDLEADRAEPDLAALRQLHGGHGRRDLERRRERLRVQEPVRVQRMDGDLGAGVRLDRGVVADVVPVAVRADDQLERPAPLRERAADPVQARDRGVDRDRLAAPLVGEDMDVGRDRADDAGCSAPSDRSSRSAEASRRPASSFGLGCSRRSGRSSCSPCPRSSARRPGERPRDRDVRRPVHRRRALGRPGQGHLAVASTAEPGAWPWALRIARSGASSRRSSS